MAVQSLRMVAWCHMPPQVRRHVMFVAFHKDEAALERQGLSYTCPAHHELESVVMSIITVITKVSVCGCRA